MPKDNPLEYTPARVKDPIPKSKHKLKRVSGGIPEHKTTMKPTPAKMKAQVKALRGA